MKNKLLLGTLITVGLLSAPVAAYAVSIFNVGQGGTGVGTFTSSQLIYGNGANPLKSVATTSVTCAGTVSCSSFTVIGASPFTITGASSGSAPVSTSSSETATYVPFWTTTSATPALLSGGNSGFTFNNAASRLTVTNASSTALTASNLYATNATIGSASALALLTSGVVSGYGGTGACGGGTAITALSATGAATCTSFGSGSVTQIIFGTGLSGGTVTTSGTVALLSYLATSSAETSGRIPFWTSTGATPALFSGGSAGLLWDSTNAKFTATNASTTALTASGALYIPQSASSSLSTTGQVAVQTGTASSSLQYQDGTLQRALYNITPSTVSIVNPAGSNATTTIPIAISGRGRTLTEGFCQSAGGGSFTGVIGNGSATTTYLQSSNAGSKPTITSLTTSNTFQDYATAYVQFGSWSQSTATTTATCSWSGYYSY